MSTKLQEKSALSFLQLLKIMDSIRFALWILLSASSVRAMVWKKRYARQEPNKALVASNTSVHCASERTPKAVKWSCFNCAPWSILLHTALGQHTPAEHELNSDQWNLGNAYRVDFDAVAMEIKSRYAPRKPRMFSKTSAGTSMTDILQQKQIRILRAWSAN